MIIFLNGVSSAGKTTLSKAIQDISKEPLLNIGIDTVIKMLPSAFINKFEDSNSNFYYHKLENNSFGEKVEIKGGLLNKEMQFLPNIVNLIAKNNNIIIDEVILSDNELKEYIIYLRDYTVYFINVYCERKITIKREQLRGNRCIGLSNYQYDLVHSGIREYDLILDSSYSNSFDMAEEILFFIQNNPHPLGFKKMEKIFINK